MRLTSSSRTSGWSVAASRSSTRTRLTLLIADEKSSRLRFYQDHCRSRVHSLLRWWLSAGEICISPLNNLPDLVGFVIFPSSSWVLEKVAMPTNLLFLFSNTPLHLFPDFGCIFIFYVDSGDWFITSGCWEIVLVKVGVGAWFLSYSFGCNPH